MVSKHNACKKTGGNNRSGILFIWMLFLDTETNTNDTRMGGYVGLQFVPNTREVPFVYGNRGRHESIATDCPKSSAYLHRYHRLRALPSAF